MINPKSGNPRVQQCLRGFDPVARELIEQYSRLSSLVSFVTPAESPQPFFLPLFIMMENKWNRCPPLQRGLNCTPSPCQWQTRRVTVGRASPYLCKRRQECAARRSSAPSVASVCRERPTLTNLLTQSISMM